MTHRRLVLLALTFAAAIVTGCRHSTTSVHGKVTYDGKPIGRGQITFSPAGGHGVVRSGPIAAGKYTVDNVPPGPKILQIIGVQKINFPKTHAEMAEAAKRGPPAAPETADEVPANAVGNGQTVEIAAGSQELNFDLKRPGAPGQRVNGTAR